ncbi:uncharacterized protein TNCV_3178311 [Trichonephila clavipes]|nr:uncharacterized protein TNCV_3178311 [Trichonephila clavipes]
MRCVPSCEKCWMQVSPVPVIDEVCPPVCASYEMCSRVSSTNLKCIMTFLLRERKDVLLEVAKELRVEIDITLPKIEFKKRICQSKYYDEESVKCLLEGILEGKREEHEERKLIREFELERLRVQLRNKLNENKLKAGNRINDLANVCILSENRTTEVSESVNKSRPVNNPVVNKSVENATSCDFEKKNCDPPVRWTNVSPLSEVSGRGTEQNNLFKIVEGKEFNVYRNSNCEVKMKAGSCEGRVRTVAMGAQRVINPDNIGEGSFELKSDKGVANPEGLICENSCEEKYTLGTLMGGCKKQLTVDQESFRNHTIAKIAGQGGEENMCKADVRKSLEDGLAMRLPLSEPREIYKDSLETDNGSNIGSEFTFEIDLPGKRDLSTIYRLNLIKLYRRKPELANLVMENSSEGIDSETLYSMLINSLREDTKYLLDLGVNGMGQSNRTLTVVWLGRVNRYPYPRIKLLYEGDTRSRWRDGQVCPDVDKELWRLGPDGSGQKKKPERKKEGEGRERKGQERPRERKKGGEESPRKSRKKGQESPGERERAKPVLNGEKGLSPEIGVKKTMNASGVEYGNRT